MTKNEASIEITQVKKHGAEDLLMKYGESTVQEISMVILENFYSSESQVASYNAQGRL